MLKLLFELFLLWDMLLELLFEEAFEEFICNRDFLASLAWITAFSATEAAIAATSDLDFRQNMTESMTGLGFWRAT